MIGTAVGNFRIVSQLGKGGMGEVWLAEQQSIKTKVAIKLLRDDVSADVSHVQRFFNEAVAVSKIRHAGIVKIFDVGFVGAPPRAYLVMELLEGETLTRRIGRARRLPLREVCDIGRQVAGVLDATHAAGIIHRDLKPDNVFLVPDAELPSGERAKVLDFGIAKLGTVGITSTSVGSMGTPLYMSPEQWRSVAKVDGRADAYSLGCVVFEMACGRPPFLADSMGEACAKHLTEAPPPASSIEPGLPPAFDQLVARLLEKEPAQRPSMREVMAELDAIAQALPAPAASSARPPVYASHGPASSPPLPSAPVPAGAATVSTMDGSRGLAASAAPATGQGTAPPLTTLGGSAGPAAAAAAAPRKRRVAWILGGAAILAAGATGGVLAVRSAAAPGEQPPGSQAPAVGSAPAPAPEAPPPPAPPPPAPAPEAPPPPAPAPKTDAPLVSPNAVHRSVGEPPKDLRATVSAQLCIDPEGKVTSVEVGLDVDPKVAAEVTKRLEAWRYQPYKRAGEAIAVCFPVTLPRKAEPAPGGGSGAGGSGAGSGGGAGSGSGSAKPPAPAIPDKLGRPEFETAMRSIEPALRACRKQRTRVGVRLSVRLNLTVRVDPAGTAAASYVSRPGIVDCIRSEVARLRFPVTKQGGSFPYELEL